MSPLRVPCAPPTVTPIYVLVIAKSCCNWTCSTAWLEERDCPGLCLISCSRAEQMSLLLPSLWCLWQDKYSTASLKIPLRGFVNTGAKIKRMQRHQVRTKVENSAVALETLSAPSYSMS